MTRNEAVKLLSMKRRCISDETHALVSFFIEAGMLKVEEEKSIIQKVEEAFRHESCTGLGAVHLLEEAGLKIVEK